MWSVVPPDEKGNKFVTSVSVPPAALAPEPLLAKVPKVDQVTNLLPRPGGETGNEVTNLSPPTPAPPAALAPGPLLANAPKVDQVTNLSLNGLKE